MISVKELSNTKLKMVRRREMTRMMTMEKTWSANTQWRMMERKNKRKMRRLKRERVRKKRKKKRKKRRENGTAAMQIITAMERKMDMRIGGWTLDRTVWNLP